MNAAVNPLPPLLEDSLHLPCSPLHFLHPWQAAFLYVFLRCRPVLWLGTVCITHIAVSTASPLGRPYKGLSFPKVKSEPYTQVLSRHLVWKNKNCLPAHPCPVSICLHWLSLSEASVLDVLSVFYSSSFPLLVDPLFVKRLRYPAYVNWQTSWKLLVFKKKKNVFATALR